MSARTVPVRARLTHPAKSAKPAGPLLASPDRPPRHAGFSGNGHFGNPANPAEFRATAGFETPQLRGLLTIFIAASPQAMCGVVGFAGFAGSVSALRTRTNEARARYQREHDAT